MKGMKQTLWMRCSSAFIIATVVACGAVQPGESTPDDDPPHGDPPGGEDQPMALELVAGDIGDAGNADGSRDDARFRFPFDVAVDVTGNTYVTDQFNHTIRKITPAGVTTTLAGAPGVSGSADGTGTAARFNQPTGIAVDYPGNIYVADTGNHTIRRITPDGVVTTYAGKVGIRGSENGPGLRARFSSPFGVSFDGANLFIGDAGNHTIRVILRDGSVSTLAGIPGVPGSNDGAPSTARFNFPMDVAVDGDGNIYVADSRNFTVRRVLAGTSVTTLAGAAGVSGGADGTGAAARFGFVSGMALEDRTLYVADTGNHTIRRVTPAGAVTTVLGTTGMSGSNDGLGAGAARFNGPSGLWIDSARTAHVADTSNHMIRKVTGLSDVVTLAGAAPRSGSADGTGAAARFSVPAAAAVDATGNIYVADQGNHTIRRVTPTGEVTTVAGTAGKSDVLDGSGAAARFSLPSGAAFDRAGNLYIADANNNTIRKITASGLVTTLAGNPRMSGAVDGPGATALFNRPAAIAVDGTDNIYVSDQNNSTIRKVTPTGDVTTFAGQATMTGNTDGVGAAARFDHPSGIAVDSAGNIYVADQNNSTIRKITPAGSATTLAGVPTIVGSTDGTGIAVRFDHPSSVAVDSAGNVYVADQNNSTIRKIAPTGATTTIAGTAGETGILLGNEPRLGAPRCLSIRGDSLVICDGNGLLLLRHAVRR